jgi:hypothetical protein
MIRQLCVSNRKNTMNKQKSNPYEKYIFMSIHVISPLNAIVNKFIIHGK